MPNKKKPGRDVFEQQRTTRLQHLPTNYGSLLQHRRPDLDIQHIYHVRAGKALDWDVLEELMVLSREHEANKNQLQAA